MNNFKKAFLLFTLIILSNIVLSQEKKFSLIPIKLFINERGFAKIEIGLGKGKKEYDKREDIKQRDISRKIREDL